MTQHPDLSRLIRPPQVNDRADGTLLEIQPPSFWKRPSLWRLILAGGATLLICAHKPVARRLESRRAGVVKALPDFLLPQMIETFVEILRPMLSRGRKDRRDPQRQTKADDLPQHIRMRVRSLEAHALWMEPSVDLYCVAAEETKARLVARGVTKVRVAVTGIPIAAKFSAPVDAPAVRKRYGLRDDLPVLLVLSGGFGMGPVAEILCEINRLTNPVQVVVVCGRNEELRRELAVIERGHPTHVLGFVSNMHELMAVSDLVLTKPGGLTSSEALAMGRPMFVLNPIPGQEAANSDFLLEHGAAGKANRVEDLPFRLEKLMNSSKLAEMAKAAQSLGKPNAATAVCQEVLARIQKD